MMMARSFDSNSNGHNRWQKSVIKKSDLQVDEGLSLAIGGLNAAVEYARSLAWQSAFFQKVPI